jgi:hypothetical protein
MRKWIIIAVMLGGALPAWADERLPPIANDAVKKECGACHLAFQPQFLPQRSWRKIMDGLPDHFGEDASLPEATRLEIAAYLEANAGDVSGSREGRRIAASIESGQTPIRITEAPRWVREHKGEVRQSTWSDPRVRSKANCVACHRGAENGWYEDD